MECVSTGVEVPCLQTENQQFLRSLFLLVFLFLEFGSQNGGMSVVPLSEN